MKNISITLDDGLLERIDGLRDGKNRSEWFRDAARARIQALSEESNDHVQVVESEGTA